MKKDNNMKKSELAYLMAHLAQDLAAECASNEELTELNKDQKVTLARYKDDIKKLKDKIFGIIIHTPYFFLSLFSINIISKFL